MQRSSDLIVALCGNDPSEHMMELVFGDFEREYVQTGALRPSSSSSLGYAVSTLMRKVVPSPHKRSPSSMAGGPLPPSRMGSFSSKLHNGFMSLLSSSQAREAGGSGRGMGLMREAASSAGSFTSVTSFARTSGGH